MCVLVWCCSCSSCYNIVSLLVLVCCCFLSQSHIPGSDLYAAPSSDPDNEDQQEQQQQQTSLTAEEPDNKQLDGLTNTVNTGINTGVNHQYVDSYMGGMEGLGAAEGVKDDAHPHGQSEDLTTTNSTTVGVTPTNNNNHTSRQTVPVPKVEIKLFVGRLPKQMTEGELEPLFGQYGSVVETVIIRDKASGQHKGSAFIKMGSITEADKAIRSLHNIKVVDNQLGPIQVKYANGEAERLGLPVENSNPGIDIGKLFVGSLPRGVTEQQVRDIFEPYGVIEETVLMKDPGTGQTKGCAFVKYAFKENAIYAIKSLNGVVSCV